MKEELLLLALGISGWLLKNLYGCTFSRGEDDDAGQRRRGYHAAPARENAGAQNRSTPPQRSPANPPESPHPYRPQPVPVGGATVPVRRSSSASVDSANGLRDTRLPMKPPEAPQSVKVSSSSLAPATQVPSTPPPSKASPSLAPSSKGPLPSPSPPPPLPSKPPPTHLPSSNATPNLPSYPIPPSKPNLPSYPIPPSKPPSKPDEDDDNWPELPEIKQKSTLPRYEIPKHLKDMIKKDKVPPVLRTPLTPATYADYFAALLYAEDFYVEKWSQFILSDVTLELRSMETFENAQEIKKTNKSVQMNKKDFVAFEIDLVPERRPFLLSRDFVFVRPSGRMTEPFKGILFRVVKGVVLVEFEDDFYAQHSSTKKYDVSFSFNRVCLKRSHHAVSAAMDPALHDILFPNPRPESSFIYSPSFASLRQTTSRILNHKGPLPYLIKGPLSTTPSDHLSSTGSIIQDVTVQIYRTAPCCRILICAPRNLTCDALMRGLHNEIPKSELFRANAAFRDYDLVPDDIKPACLYEGECFTCPPLTELQDFKVITSTFMSSFRLHAAGINANHFTHIFLVDASSATEPEAVVALVNLVSKKTVVVVTGSFSDAPGLVRADMARRHGLKKSYFHRLLEREPYLGQDPKFITNLA